jgi:pyruvate dehydrogenase E2 component (dihydrolipoamide acetyltransferase)
VTREDVQGASRDSGGQAPISGGAQRAQAAALPHAAMAGDERIPFRGVRRKIADNMTRSKHSAAHFTYVEECDVTELAALRARARKRAEERGVKLSFLPFIVKAVVSGLKKYPIVNATLDAEREEIVLRKRYHLGVAAATEAGLVVPVLRDADQLSLFQIGAQLEQLSEKARTGKASREELTGSTFTISSLGALGGVLATPIINFPEVAVLGVHKMKEAPVVRDGQIVIRTMMNLSISLDHRIVDGYEGAQFLAHVVSLLEDPTVMFMEMV